MRTDLEHLAADLVMSGADLGGVYLAFDRLLRRSVPYVAAAWSTHDPATGLFTSCTLSGLEEDREREAHLFSCEFRDGEPGSYPSLIERGASSAILSEITDGQLARAARYREVFSPFGVTDELRVICWADRRVWGSISMYRIDGTFTSEHAASATALAPFVAQATRLTLLRLATMRPNALDDPPGIVQVSADGTVTAVTEPAQRWLTLGGATLVTALNVTAAAIREHRDWLGAKSRLVLSDGRVLSLQAASMVDEAGGVAVIVDAARAVDIGAMLVDAYGLTPRQREVLGLLLLGRSMAEIALELRISEYTANDHRKAIYQRMDVSSRSELAAMLQSEQYTPRSYAGAPPSPYGGFLPTGE